MMSLKFGGGKTQPRKRRGRREKQQQHIEQPRKVYFPLGVNSLQNPFDPFDPFSATSFFVAALFCSPLHSFPISFLAFLPRHRVGSPH
jgi:hypothetical protein